MGKKVCMLVAHHPFLDARIFKKEAKSLLKKGYEVTLVVPKKNGYLYDIDGKPFTERYLKPTFMHEGIKIVTYEDSRESVKQMISNLESRGHGSFNNMLTKVGLAQKADIYHAHEFLSFYSGIGIKRELGAAGKSVKLIYDSHELTPDPLEKRDPAKKKALQRMLDLMVQEVDYIITVSEAIKAWYLKKNPGLKIEVIVNSPPLSKNYKVKDAKKKGMTACHEGAITSKKGNLELLLAITRICARDMDFKFKIIGGMRHEERLFLPDDLSKRIMTTGWVDYHAIPEQMNNVDVGWLHFKTKNSLNCSYAMPNKFFSYLNNGVPIIVNKCYEMARFIRKHKCGIVIDKDNPTAEDYAKAILFLNEHREKWLSMSKQARTIMMKKYSWEHMEKRLYNVYKRMYRNK